MTFKINRHELKWNSREIEVPWWLGLSQQVTTKPEPDDDPKSKYNLGHMLPSGWDLTMRKNTRCVFVGLSKER